MKKIACLILCFLISGAYTICAASTKSVTPQVYSGISNYKKANYTGCIQDMEAALKKNPNDVLAKYYLALVYTKIGLQEDAKKYYQQVVDQNSEKILTKYSQKALVCLDNPNDEKCVKKEKDDDGMSEFIESGEFLHPDLKKSLQKRELKDVKDSFNADQFPDMDNYRFINDAKDRTQPTDAQIAAAVKILAKVGYNPAAQVYNNAFINPSAASFNMMNTNQNSNNNFLNMLPYLMAQKNGTQNSNISPELIQTMLMNQAIPGFDFNN